MSYYNTTKQKGKDLKKNSMKALSQQVLIKIFMKANSDISFTPFEVQDAFLKDDFVWPITSVRRALSDLTDKDILTKSEETVIGDYGRPNYKWQWKG
jgi:Fe2+ or Zn2+ uptake regulation protein